MYELDVMLDCLDSSIKQAWEQTRYQCYSIFQSQSSKKIAPTDIMQFNWDKTEKKQITVSNEDRKRLTEKARKIMKEKQDKINGSR